MNDKAPKNGHDRATEVAAYLAAISASLVSVWATTRREFYSYMKSFGAFKNIEQTRADQLAALENKPKTTEYLKDARAIQNAYSKGVGRIYGDIGIGEHVMTSSWRKFRHLGTTGKLKVAGVGVTVGLGATFSLLNLSHRHHVEKVLDKLTAADNPSQGR